MPLTVTAMFAGAFYIVTSSACVVAPLPGYGECKVYSLETAKFKLCREWRREA